MTGVLDAVGAAVAFLSGVDHAELEGVDAHFLRELVDDALGGEAGLRRAGRAVGRGLRLVDRDVVAVNQDVVDGVGGEHALSARAHGGTGEGAGLEYELGVGGDDLAVLGGAHLAEHLRP